jgi:hypothetical protein
VPGGSVLGRPVPFVVVGASLKCLPHSRDTAIRETTQWPCLTGVNPHTASNHGPPTQEVARLSADFRAGRADGRSRQIARTHTRRRPSPIDRRLRNPKDYEDFLAAARFSAQYRFEAAMMRFLPAALSFRLGFVATVASGSDSAFFAAHLFC